jgi:hypothetical protein
MAARNLYQNCGVCAAVSVWRLAGPKSAWDRRTEESSDNITTTLSFYSRTYAIELRHFFCAYKFMYGMGAEIFQRSISHLKILVARRVS